MKKLFVILILCTAIFAQDLTLRGKVVNSENGEILVGANVQAENSSFGTVTDKNGEFLLSNLKMNDFIFVSYIGFSTEKVYVRLLSKSILIALKPKILSTQSIVIQGFEGKNDEKSAGFSELKSNYIEENFSNQSIPEILSNLPSTTFYSDDGGSLGYSFLNIRGFEQRRISISVNGIPQNDPEDHNVYWIDIPDLLSSTDLIQVQLGAGNSLIGFPSIGGSINLITSPFSNKKEIKLSSNFGSFNIRQFQISATSGLIDNKYSIYAKFGRTLKSGYRDLAWADYQSFHFTIARYDENITTNFNFYGGPINDGLVYLGLPKNVISEKNLRKENYSYWDYDYENNRYQDWSTKRRSEEKEYYSQPHFELLNEIKISEDILANSAVFWIIGNGYFDFDGSWADTNALRLTSDFGFSPTQNPTNTIIRATVNNNQFGWIPRLQIQHENGEFTFGSEIHLHNSEHFGIVKYANSLPENLSPERKFYYYEGGKTVFNLFVNENYQFNSTLNYFLELQVANHKYSISNEKFLSNNFSVGNTFFNPRMGLNYKILEKMNLFLSMSQISREPMLKNYYDAEGSYYGQLPNFLQDSNGNYDFSEPLVKPEMMRNLELGWNYRNENLFVSANFYYMLFENEIVKNGQVGIFGDAITGNMPKTIHSGIELSTTFEPTNWLNILSNLTLSKNYIKEGIHVIDEENSINLANNKIGGFPEMLGNIVISASKNRFSSTLILKYVGSYYSDNFDENLTSYISKYPFFVGYNDNKVDSYFVANAKLGYKYEGKEIIKNGKIFVQVNNIFNNLYAHYAVGKEFFPAAELNILAGISVSL